jgi:hypothetical protein
MGLPPIEPFSPEEVGELFAHFSRLVDLLLTNASTAELKAVQDQVRTLLDQLESAATEEPGQPGDGSQRPDLGSA